MERVASIYKDRIMSADKAAKLIRTGMNIGMSGFTIVGYPKEVPKALCESGHASDLTLCIGASVGDELDGEMVRAGIIKKRFAYQSNKSMRDAINRGTVGYSDMHISHFPLAVNQRTDHRELFTPGLQTHAEGVFRKCNEKDRRASHAPRS